jgi:hypothetical protein
LLAGYERVQAVKQEQERRSREAELVGAFAITGGFRQDETEPLHLPCPSPLPSSDAVVASQQAWRAVRSHLNRHGTQLAKQAVRLYDPAWRLTHTPVLAPPSWLPSHPVPIETVTLEWVAAPPRPAITGHEAELRPVLPGFYFYYNRDDAGKYANEESPYRGCYLPTEVRRLRERYGYEQVTCTGRAGTLMLFDNLGPHRPRLHPAPVRSSVGTPHGTSSAHWSAPTERPG